jgi:putative ABC transport system permease protein
VKRQLLLRSRLRPADFIYEIFRSLAASPFKAAGTAAGVVLASSAFVATFGLAATLSNQVSGAFDALRSTEIVVTAPEGAALDDDDLCMRLPISNVTRLSGVNSVGVYQLVRDRAITVAVDPKGDVSAPIVGVDTGSLRVLAPHLVAGRLPDAGHNARADAVAVIPQRLADTLQIPGVGSTIRVAGRPTMVMGIFDDLKRRPDALGAVLMPNRSMARLLHSAVTRDDLTCGSIIETSPGAASALAGQVPLALSPEAPDSLRVNSPPDPRSFRRQLEGPIRLLCFALTAAALLIGIISIATTASSSVAGRVAEIGLRKAIGARPRHILLQLLGESAVLGLLGAMAGVFLGSFVVIGVSLANQWQPILDFRSALFACAGGSAIGGLAGLWPAAKAARTPAVDSLRR